MESSRFTFSLTNNIQLLKGQHKAYIFNEGFISENIGSKVNTFVKDTSVFAKIPEIPENEGECLSNILENE